MRFKEGVNGINSMVFQDVGKPLASVSRFLDTGTSVVFSLCPKGSYVANDQTGAQNSVRGGERNVCHGIGVLAAADRRRHRFCPAGRLRLGDTYVGHDLPAKSEELCPVGDGEPADEPQSEEVVEDYDEVEDLQRGENVPARVQDPNCFRGTGKTMECWKMHRGETEKALHVDSCFMRSRLEVAKDFDSKNVMLCVAPLRGACHEYPARRTTAFIKELGLEVHDLVLRSD